MELRMACQTHLGQQAMYEPVINTFFQPIGQMSGLNAGTTDDAGMTVELLM